MTTSQPADPAIGLVKFDVSDNYVKADRGRRRMCVLNILFLSFFQKALGKRGEEKKKKRKIRIEMDIFKERIG